MNGIEHSFPLPETEAHKLDEMKEELAGPRQGRRVEEYRAPNLWVGVIAGAVGGLLLGLWLNSQD